MWVLEGEARPPGVLLVGPTRHTDPKLQVPLPHHGGPWWRMKWKAM